MSVESSCKTERKEARNQEDREVEYSKKSSVHSFSFEPIGGAFFCGVFRNCLRNTKVCIQSLYFWVCIASKSKPDSKYVISGTHSRKKAAFHVEKAKIS